MKLVKSLEDLKLVTLVKVSKNGEKLYSILNIKVAINNEHIRSGTKNLL